MSCVDPRSPLPSPLKHRTIGSFETPYAVAVVRSDLTIADAALREIAEAGLDIERLSIVWRPGPAEPCDLGERKRFWEACSALWGGAGDLPLGGVMITLPRLGPVLIGGHLAVLTITGIRPEEHGSSWMSGFGSLGAALVGMGLTHDDLLSCWEALEVDGVFVVGSGLADEVEVARDLLCDAGDYQLSVHAADQGLAFAAQRAARPAHRLSAASGPALPDRPRSVSDTSLQEIR